MPLTQATPILDAPGPISPVLATALPTIGGSLEAKIAGYSFPSTR